MLSERLNHILSVTLFSDSTVQLVLQCRQTLAVVNASDPLRRQATNGDHFQKD